MGTAQTDAVRNEGSNEGMHHPCRYSGSIPLLRTKHQSANGVATAPPRGFDGVSPVLARARGASREDVQPLKLNRRETGGSSEVAENEFDMKTHANSCLVGTCLGDRTRIVTQKQMRFDLK